MRHLLLAFFLVQALFSYSQEIKSPSEFLGYGLGSQFTHYHQVMDYYRYLSQVASDRVQLQEYGKTYEQRPLTIAIVSSSENMRNLEDIRKDHLPGSKKNTSAKRDSNAIVWLSYNVHGNESSGTEASMQTIYELLVHKSSFLDKTVVIIDPCLNPDGRERYVNWYYQFRNIPNTLDPNSKEHHEGWLSGRTNHYMFDLNRDWAWATQAETQQRLKIYNRWLPHVHADFHEQGVDKAYYFAPAAEPFHEVITDFQREFQAITATNHAKYFDANGWPYFTQELFDLFYPSYGDTYPTYNGSIGMTYEQGGSGHAGLGVLRSLGDTLTLKERIAHHLVTGLSTVEVASKNSERLNKEFEKFYQPKNYTYKSYLLNGNPDKINALTQLLDRHDIRYGWGREGIEEGFDFSTSKQGRMATSSRTLVVNTDQTKATLVKVLFEPQAKLSDSLTYDITAWSLPYAYGLEALACTNLVAQYPATVTAAERTDLSPDALAFVAEWKSIKDAQFLADLLKRNIRVRLASKSFKMDGEHFDPGSLIISKSDNAHNPQFLITLDKMVEKNKITIAPMIDSEGIGQFPKIEDTRGIHDIRIAVLSGDPTDPLVFGEVWHFFEQQLQYPVTVLNSDYFRSVDLSLYDVLILPDGEYGDFFNKEQLKYLKKWIQTGGKTIAMGGAIKAISREKDFGITPLVERNRSNRTYGRSEREEIKDEITGAIFKTEVDNSQPLAYGYGDTYFSLKLGNDAYPYLKEGNVAYINKREAGPVSGFAGSEARKKMERTLVFGVEKYGEGHIVYMVDDPLFRGFWANGQLFFVNALFMVGE